MLRKRKVRLGEIVHGALKGAARRIREEQAIVDHDLTFEQLEFRMLDQMNPFDRQVFASQERCFARWAKGESRHGAYLDCLDEIIALYEAIVDPTEDQVVKLSGRIEERQAFLEKIGGDPRYKPTGGI